MRGAAAAGLATLAALAMIGLPAEAAKPAPSGSSPVAASTFSGRSYVAAASVTALTVPLSVGPISDTGPLPASGGFLHNSLLTVAASASDVLSLQGEVASASTAGAGAGSDSAASVAALSLGVGLGGSTAPLLTVNAGVLRSQAQAKCTSKGAVTTGGSSIAELQINGAVIQVSGQPNQTIELDNLATIIINEQTSGPGSITVNALHVILHQNSVTGPLLSGDVVISSAHADLTCQPTAPPPAQCPVKDFVTGGGYISDGGRISFGLVGGLKPDGLSGHLNVVDHGTGQHIKAATLVTYSDPAAPSTQRRLVYSGDIDGQPATITVNVADNGEPGTSDTFSVTSGTYSRSGTLSGGNIQLHKPDGCQTATRTKGH